MSALIRSLFSVRALLWLLLLLSGGQLYLVQGFDQHVLAVSEESAHRHEQELAAQASLSLLESSILRLSLVLVQPASADGQSGAQWQSEIGPLWRGVSDFARDQGVAGPEFIALDGAVATLLQHLQHAGEPAGRTALKAAAATLSGQVPQMRQVLRTHALRQSQAVALENRTHQQESFWLSAGLLGGQLLMLLLLFVAALRPLLSLSECLQRLRNDGLRKPEAIECWQPKLHELAAVRQSLLQLVAALAKSDTMRARSAAELSDLSGKTTAIAASIRGAVIEESAVGQSLFESVREMRASLQQLQQSVEGAQDAVKELGPQEKDAVMTHLHVIHDIARAWGAWEADLEAAMDGFDVMFQERVALMHSLERLTAEIFFHADGMAAGETKGTMP